MLIYTELMVLMVIGKIVSPSCDEQQAFVLVQSQNLVPAKVTNADISPYFCALRIPKLLPVPQHVLQ